MLPIIITCGTAGSGKDTAAKWIADNYNGVCIGQADPIKAMLLEFFPFSQRALYGDSKYREVPLAKSNARTLRHGNAGIGRWRLEYWFDRLSICPSTITSSGSTIAEDLDRWQAECYNLAVTGKLTPRHALQTLGTEWGRSYDEDLWINIAKESALKLINGGYTYDRKKGFPEKNASQKGYDFAIITDGRFRNEILKIAEIGKTVMIRRKLTSLHGHVSETQIRKVPEHFFNYIINNDGSKKDFEKKLKELMNNVMKSNQTTL